MYTERILIRDKENINPQEEEGLRRAGAVLSAGGLVAFPTETVYGLGADALDREAAKKIYAAKGRPSDNPLIVHIARQEDIRRLVSEVPQVARQLMDRFWPGPLTLIFPKSRAVPYETTGGLDTVAVRMPSDPVALRLIELAGVPVAAPSANKSGRPSPTCAAHVLEDLGGTIEMIVDGGAVGIGLESTIVDVSGGDLTILRPGAVTKDMIEDALKCTVCLDPAVQGLMKPGDRPKAPGMKYRHYAPKAPLTLVTGRLKDAVGMIDELARRGTLEGRRIGILCSDETRESYRCGVIKSLGKRDGGGEAARNLYGALREFDELGVDEIYSECFEEGKLGAAVMNRLAKAAGRRTIDAGRLEDKNDDFEEK